MRSHLKEFVKKMADNKELGWSSFRDSRIRSVERMLDKGEITREDAIGAVAKELGYKFDRHDTEDLDKYLSKL